MRVKEEGAKAGLKLSIQKTKIVASSPITSWQIGGGKEETVTDFIFLGSKITVDSVCSLEIERHLLLGRKAMTNQDNILKRDISFANNVWQCHSKLRVFPLVMNRCENRTMMKAELGRTDTFELWFWKKLLRVPLACKEIKRVNPKRNKP